MAAPQPAAPKRRRDPVRTRGEILEVATREFADQGFTGARVDEIAARTRTTKRMIYYCFGSKEQLYIEVLECAYARIRSLEREVDVEHRDPRAAIRLLAELTFDHHGAHADFIRLVSIENIHHAEHMRKSDRLANLNSPAIDLIDRILRRGLAENVFRPDARIVPRRRVRRRCVGRAARPLTDAADIGSVGRASETRLTPTASWCSA